MLYIIEFQGIRIGEYGDGFLKRNPMLAAIPSRLCRIPFEIHRLMLHRGSGPSNGRFCDIKTPFHICSVSEKMGL